MNLYDEISSETNLWSAWQTVRRKNARGGIDGVAPEDMDAHIRTAIQDLSEKLKAGAYTPTPLQRINVPKFNEANEWRSLSLPVVTDKVVQQAAVNLLTPVFEKEFLDCSYAYRPRKGPVRAIKCVEHILNKKLRWAVCCDIDNCFDSFNHEKLLKAVAEKIPDDRMIQLIGQWLQAGCITQKGDFIDPTDGISQGSVISPLLSNIYLHHLDVFTQSQKHPYIRYGDNIIVFFYQKEHAFKGKEVLTAFLEDELLLKLNADDQAIRHVLEGFSFLGVFFKGDERSISREKVQKAIRKLTWLTEPGRSESPEAMQKRLNEHVVAQKRFYEIIKPDRQFQEFDTHLVKRINILMIYYARKNVMTTKAQFQSFTSTLQFYCEIGDKEKQKRIEGLINEVIKSLQAEKKKKSAQKENGKTPDGTLKKTARAQASRFLKQIGEETEVVISTPGVFIGKTANRLVLRADRKKVHEQPFAKIRQITIITNGVSLSSDVITACAANKIPLVFLGKDGTAKAILSVPDCDASLTVIQARMVDTEKSLNLSKRILVGKCRNQMNVLKFYTRHRSRTDPGFHERVKQNLNFMEKSVAELQETVMSEDFSAVKNHLFIAEARVGGYYWDIIKILLPPELGFDRREKHGATDVVNSMLNYGYGILYQRLWQAASAVGLNPNISFLHSFQKGKPTFIYDIIEEFRQPFVDRPLFSILTKGSRYKKLKVDASGLMDAATKEIILQTVLQKLSSLTVFRGKKMRAEEILHIQVKKLAEYIAGKSSNYLPYIATY